jgi:PhnB protein
MIANAYLNFPGTCEEAFTFYAKVLNGKIEAMMPHEGTPAEGYAPPDWKKKIIHASMTIGNTQLMASDCPPEHFEPMKGMTVALHIDDPKEAERVFNGLAKDGTVKMALEKTFWAEKFGMLVDRFGTPWMINCAPGAA